MKYPLMKRMEIASAKKKVAAIASAVAMRFCLSAAIAGAPKVGPDENLIIIL